MTELEISQQKLHEAETKLKQKELEWFVIKFVLVPMALSIVGAVAVLAVTVINLTFK